jgi:hypothetical protein
MLNYDKKRFSNDLKQEIIGRFGNFGSFFFPITRNFKEIDKNLFLLCLCCVLAEEELSKSCNEYSFPDNYPFYFFGILEKELEIKIDKYLI